MLVLGSSKPWQDAMQAITGQRKMSVKPLLDYFQPLMEWLKKQNKEENVGWSENCPSKIPHPSAPPTSTTTCGSQRLSISYVYIATCVLFLCTMFKSWM